MWHNVSHKVVQTKCDLNLELQFSQFCNLVFRTYAHNINDVKVLIWYCAQVIIIWIPQSLSNLINTSIPHGAVWETMDSTYMQPKWPTEPLLWGSLINWTDWPIKNESWSTTYSGSFFSNTKLVNCHHASKNKADQTNIIEFFNF
jgi:hypothetical protein